MYNTDNMIKLPGKVESNALFISACSKDSESAVESTGSSLSSFSSISIGCWVALSCSWSSFSIVGSITVSEGKDGGRVGGGSEILKEIYWKIFMMNIKIMHDKNCLCTCIIDY